MSAADQDKQSLRRQFRRLRRQRDDQAIRASVLKLLLPSNSQPRFTRNAGHLGLYWPLPGEPDLMPLLPNLWGWSLALPCSDGQGGMSYRPWDGGPLDDCDGCGIPAPIGSPPLQSHQLQLLLVPALAVDHSGIRLGYGGGYYDRLRGEASWRQRQALVVLPTNCISHEGLPREPWDQPFHGWVCEQGVTWCS